MDLDLVWVIYRGESKVSEEAALFCINSLQKIGTKVIARVSDSSINTFKDLISNNEKLPNLAIILGGDGTVLGAARELAIHKIPILSFNVGGNLGFLTHDHRILTSNNLWDRILTDRFTIQLRMMLEAKVIYCTKKNLENNAHISWALNDFYFKADRDEVSPTCNLGLEIDDEEVNQFRGDGLICATPTGSTAYAMATGGPILHPGIEAIVISAICPMSLSSRPIVVPAASRLMIKPIGKRYRSIRLWQDGASAALLEVGDHCIIKRSKHHSMMIVLDETPSYYQTLAQKLNWANSFTKS